MSNDPIASLRELLDQFIDTAVLAERDRCVRAARQCRKEHLHDAPLALANCIAAIEKGPTNASTRS